MSYPTNAFTQAIRRGEKQVGLWVSLCHGLSAEIIATSDFDWVVLDMEHSPNDLATVMHQLQVFDGSGTTALVRPDWNDSIKVKRLLDTGAPGLVFPMVQSVTEAEAAVAATRYPPNGIRGVAGVTRASNYGRSKDYTARVETETTVVIQLETRVAIEQVEQIAAVDGVTGIFFGPADIAADLGYLGNTTHPEVWELIMGAVRKLQAMNVPAGTLVLDPEFAKKLLNDGFTFVACGTDAALLTKAADSLAATVKSGV